MKNRSFTILFLIRFIYLLNINNKCITFIPTLQLIITNRHRCNSFYAQSNTHIIYNSYTKYLKIGFLYFENTFPIGKERFLNDYKLSPFSIIFILYRDIRWIDCDLKRKQIIYWKHILYTNIYSLLSRL